MISCFRAYVTHRRGCTESCSHGRLRGTCTCTCMVHIVCSVCTCTCVPVYVHACTCVHISSLTPGLCVIYMHIHVCVPNIQAKAVTQKVLSTGGSKVCDVMRIHTR